MNEVSIIINGTRYDAVSIDKNLLHPHCCDLCSLGHICIKGDTCLCYTFNLDNDIVFKKSTKSFER